MRYPVEGFVGTLLGDHHSNQIGFHRPHPVGDAKGATQMECSFQLLLSVIQLVSLEAHLSADKSGVEVDLVGADLVWRGRQGRGSESDGISQSTLAAGQHGQGGRLNGLGSVAGLKPIFQDGFGSVRFAEPEVGSGGQHG